MNLKNITEWRKPDRVTNGLEEVREALHWLILTTVHEQVGEALGWDWLEGAQGNFGDKNVLPSLLSCPQWCVHLFKLIKYS